MIALSVALERGVGLEHVAWCAALRLGPILTGGRSRIEPAEVLLVLCQPPELTDQLARLTDQVAKLTEVLGRNSRNWHLPPSSDGPGSGSRTGQAGHQSRKSARKRGGQKGHRGSYRELLPPERVDAAARARGRTSSMLHRAATSSWNYATINRTSPSGTGTRSSVSDAAPPPEQPSTAV